VRVLNNKLFKQVKVILDNCETLDKREAINRVINMLHLTQSVAMEYYKEWKRDYLKGINIQALCEQFQPISIIVKSENAIYQLEKDKIKILKELPNGYSSQIPDECLDLETIRKHLVSNKNLGDVNV
jgi:hypothetical protein